MNACMFGSVGITTSVILKMCYPTVGFVSNGEFNYLRSKGYTRPVSVFQIRAMARRKYSHLGKSSLLEMLTPSSE